ncbi:MAG: GGDEF domain-containing protein [Steroidobacteraceae bacterium]
MPAEKSVSEVKLGTKLFAAAALSYLVDGVLLAGYAAAGIVNGTIPAAYLFSGLLSCAVFYRLTTNSFNAWLDRYLPLLHVVTASALQVAFIVLAPQPAFYFLALLFIVFGFGSLGLSSRQSSYVWIGVAMSVAAVTSALHIAIVIPQATPLQQCLVWLCFVATLGRCVLLGALGRSMRLHLQDRRRQLRISVEMLEERDKSLARVNLELKRQATHDALTGLANRGLFVERMEQAMREGEAFAVCALDLDRFKVINDSLGHGAGDTLLQCVSRRLLSATRADDTVARAGGDEFLMLLRGIRCIEEAEAQVARCLLVLSEPHRLANKELRVSSSIGVARYPKDGIAAEELLAQADEAMYHAKRSGRNTYRLFDPTIKGFSRESQEIDADLPTLVSAAGIVAE